jgi:hypothetical protein
MWITCTLVDVWNDKVTIQKDGKELKNPVEGAFNSVVYRKMMEQLKGSVCDGIEIPNMETEEEHALAVILGLNPHVELLDHKLILSDLYDPTNSVRVHYNNYINGKETADDLKQFVSRFYGRDETFSNGAKTEEGAEPAPKAALLALNPSECFFAIANDNVFIVPKDHWNQFKELPDFIEVGNFQDGLLEECGLDCTLKGAACFGILATTTVSNVRRLLISKGFEYSQELEDFQS